MTYLSVKNLAIHFGGITAVDHLDFEVRQGQVVSIIGPNGAGKTTVFNLLSGLYQANEGQITFDGINITGKTVQEIAKTGIARTFQNIRLFSDMRVIENVLIGTHIQTKYRLWNSLLRSKSFRNEEEEKKRYAAKLLKEVGLQDRIDDYADNLPYGDQRKLEIVRAIATGAKLILLDEPAAGMNPQESEELRKFIRKLKEKGYTILLIEHDMNVVMNVSDYIYVLDYGKKIAQGKPEEILANKRVTAAYLGESEVEE